jgi:hypothetical protein
MSKFTCKGCLGPRQHGVSGYCKAKNCQKLSRQQRDAARRGKPARQRVKGRTPAQWYYDRLKADPAFRACKNARVRVGLFLRNKSCNSKSLGASCSELRSYIEAKFSAGMSWENYGEWHLDHIYPLSVAYSDGPDAFAKACHYTNLQPLWRRDNLVKSNRVSI